jgi:hypothetical protein
MLRSVVDSWKRASNRLSPIIESATCLHLLEDLGDAVGTRRPEGVTVDEVSGGSSQADHAGIEVLGARVYLHAATGLAALIIRNIGSDAH